MKTIIIDGVEYNLTPKVAFHEGDWVVYDHRSYQVVELPKEGYINLGLKGNGKVVYAPSTYCRHWTIKDAKNCDVLATKGGGIFIYKELLYDKPFAYCGVDKFGVFKDCNCGDGLDWTPYLSDVTPATKEQRDLLFQKMREAGYKWDAEKKELKKVEQKPAEWSEEDKHYLRHALFSTYAVDVATRIINKALRPQSQWKPSQSMINALSTAIKYGQTDDQEELLELLKRLKEL